MQTNLRQLTTAFRIAFGMGILPSALSSEQLAEELARSVWETSVVSARTTSAVYLDAVQKALVRITEGGRNNDKAQIRLELKQLLQALGYDFAKGFPGDAELGIPPAEKGSLRDLSSDRRINLVLDTQMALISSKVDELEGMEPTALHFAPAWRLVRVEQRRVPRGSVGSGSPGWETRWLKVGGKLIDYHGELIMAALKTDPIWELIGSRVNFADALNTNRPPFAFNSGYGWDVITLAKARDMGFDLSKQKKVEFGPTKTGVTEYGRDSVTVPTTLAPPVVNLDSVSPNTREFFDLWFKTYHDEFGMGEVV